MDHVPCALEQTVYSVVAVYSVLWMSVGSSWFAVLYIPSISLSTFCILVACITENKVLKSPAVVELAISLFKPEFLFHVFQCFIVR